MVARTAWAKSHHGARRISGEHVRGDAAKRDGQVVEAGDAGIGEGDAIEQQADALAGIESIGTVEAVLQAERGWDLVVAAVLLCGDTRVAVAGLAGSRASSQSMASTN